MPTRLPGSCNSPSARLVALASFFLAVVLTAGRLFGEPATRPADSDRFEKLPGDAATAMTLDDDGLNLFTAHESAGYVGVWDVQTGRQLTKVPVESPRYLISRGKTVYVANRGAGTVTLLARHGDKWAVDRKVAAGAPGVFYLSAPVGKAFDGQLLVTCDTVGGDTVYLIDTGHVEARHPDAGHPDTQQSAEPRLLSSMEGGIATWSADGGVVVEQATFESFRRTRLYDRADYMSGRLTLRGEMQSKPESFLYQVPGKTQWFCGDSLYAHDLEEPFGTARSLVVPDLHHNLMYTIFSNAIIARATSFGGMPRARREIKTPAEMGDYFTIEMDPGQPPAVVWNAVTKHALRPRRFGDPRGLATNGRPPFAAPAAVTRGERLYLFLFWPADGTIWRRDMPAFADGPPPPVPSPPVKSPRPPVPASVAAEVEATDLPVGADTIEPIEIHSNFVGFDVSEDGRWLAAGIPGHVLVWDLANGKCIRQFHSTDPYSLLWRRGLLYVASLNDDTIRAYDPATDWHVSAEFKFDGQLPLQMAAARGAAFDGKILVRTQSAVYVINTADRLARKLYQPVEISQILVGAGADQVLEVSPGGGGTSVAPELLDYKTYVSGNRPIRRNQQREPVDLNLYQARPGQLWFGHTAIWAGQPLTDYSGTLSDWGTVVPDRTRDLFYVFAKGRLRFFETNANLTEIGTRPVKSPPQAAEAKDFSLGPFPSQSRPVAFTVGDVLSIFFLSDDHNLYRYQTRATPDPLHEIVAEGEKGIIAIQEFPSRLVEGKPLTFHLFATDTHGTFKMYDGPDGIRLSDYGVLDWTPTKQDIGTVDFRIQADVNGQTSFIRVACEIIPADLVAGTGGDLVAAASLGKHHIAAGNLHLSPTFDGTAILLLQDRQLRVLDAEGMTERQLPQMPKSYLKIAQRRNGFVAVAKDSVDLLDLTNARLLKSIRLDPTGVLDAAFDPARPMTYIAPGDLNAEPFEVKNPLIEVDEAAATTVARKDVYAIALGIDPAGRQLYVQSPFSLPTALAADRKYPFDHLSSLLAYDLTRSTWPVTSRKRRDDPGPQWVSVAVSPDGALIASLPGSLSGSRLLGLSAGDLVNARVAFDVRRARFIAFHPFLQIAAVTDGQSVTLFNLKTGAPAERRIDFGAERLDVFSSNTHLYGRVTGLLFAPSGRNLLVTYVDNHRRRLVQAFPLIVDAEELRALSVAPANPKPAAFQALGLATTGPVHPPQTVAAADLEALADAAGPATPLTAKEIGRRYMDAVALVTTNDGSGTAFFVGRKGYLVTCAHVLPEAGDTSVSYRKRTDGEVDMQKAPASVVRVDRKRDLALLKIESTQESAFPTVRLATKDDVEMGEDVTAIGHPGFGRTVLDFTMTTGIVSNPDRRPINVSILQTNAAVNPGSSGGPLFDGDGRVIGVVVAKAAKVEGVGFAIAVKELRAFLREAASAN